MTQQPKPLRTNGSHAFAEWRIAIGITLVDMGTRLGVSKGYVHNLETGYRLPGRQLANLIAKLSAQDRMRIDPSEWEAIPARRAG